MAAPHEEKQQEAREATIQQVQEQLTDEPVTKKRRIEDEVKAEENNSEPQLAHTPLRKGQRKRQRRKARRSLESAQTQAANEQVTTGMHTVGEATEDILCRRLATILKFFKDTVRLSTFGTDINNRDPYSNRLAREWTELGTQYFDQVLKLNNNVTLRDQWIRHWTKILEPVNGRPLLNLPESLDNALGMTYDRSKRETLRELEATETSWSPSLMSTPTAIQQAQSNSSLATTGIDLTNEATATLSTPVTHNCKAKQSLTTGQLLNVVDARATCASAEQEPPKDPRRFQREPATSTQDESTKAAATDKTSISFTEDPEAGLDIVHANNDIITQQPLTAAESVQGEDMLLEGSAVHKKKALESARAKLQRAKLQKNLAEKKRALLQLKQQQQQQQQQVQGPLRPITAFRKGELASLTIRDIQSSGPTERVHFALTRTLLYDDTLEESTNEDGAGDVIDEAVDGDHDDGFDRKSASAPTTQAASLNLQEQMNRLIQHIVQRKQAMRDSSAADNEDWMVGSLAPDDDMDDSVAPSPTLAQLSREELLQRKEQAERLKVFAHHRHLVQRNRNLLEQQTKDVEQTVHRQQELQDEVETLQQSTIPQLEHQCTELSQRMAIVQHQLRVELQRVMELRKQVQGQGQYIASGTR